MKRTAVMKKIIIGAGTPMMKPVISEQSFLSHLIIFEVSYLYVEYKKRFPLPHYLT